MIGIGFIYEFGRCLRREAGDCFEAGELSVGSIFESDEGANNR